MENASKALIIAGAILLSIVLITLGVLIIGRGQEAIDKANIDEQVVSTWNQKFSKYAGKSVSGTSVNTLLNEVLSSNAINKTDAPEKLIKVVWSGTDDTKKIQIQNTGTPAYTTATSSAVSTKKYEVYISAYSAEGFISEITLK